MLPSSYVYADPTHCDQPGWPSCYSVGYTDGQKNPGNSCPTGHSTEFCRGWVDASRPNIRTATSISRVISRVYNWAVIFVMLWINNIFLLDKVTEKPKLTP